MSIALIVPPRLVAFREAFALPFTEAEPAGAKPCVSDTDLKLWTAFPAAKQGAAMLITAQTTAIARTLRNKEFWGTFMVGE